MTLLELAERCEQATGPDRELNYHIAKALGFVHETDRGPLFLHNGKPGSWSPLRYTASLDAAMLLVPEGMDWFKERGLYAPNIAVIQGPICAFAGETDSFILALCAAALRARANHLDDGGEK